MASVASCHSEEEDAGRDSCRSDSRGCNRPGVAACLSLAVALISLLLIAGCASRSRREWLVFFFDGVPPQPGSVTNAAAPQAGSGAAPAATNTAPRPASPTVVRHAPFVDRQCNECHESKFSQKLRGKVKDICLGCHSDLFDKAAHKHSPAEDGECLQCHDPHQALQKALLKKSVNTLCYDCHDQADVKGGAAHAAMGDAACTSCHDPHGSERKFLLKKGQAAPAGASPSP